MFGTPGYAHIHEIYNCSKDDFWAVMTRCASYYCTIGLTCDSKNRGRSDLQFHYSPPDIVSRSIISTCRPCIHAPVVVTTPAGKDGLSGRIDPERGARHVFDDFEGKREGEHFRRRVCALCLSTEHDNRCHFSPADKDFCCAFAFGMLEASLLWYAVRVNHTYRTRQFRVVLVCAP